MESKAVKLSLENYRWLAGLAAELQRQKKRPISLDDALNEVKKKKTSKISSFAGIWKMSDEEAENLKDDVRKGWKSWKTKSV